MTTEELEARAEMVKVFFLNQIMELSDSEVEVILDYLTQYFDEALEQVRQTTR